MRGARSILLFLLGVVACGDNDVPNEPPVLESFELTTAEDLPVTRALGATDPEGAALTASIPDPPAHGTAVISGTSLTYTPAPDYHGTDLFSVSVTDGTDSTTVIIEVTVTSVNDAPLGVADSIAAEEDTARIVPQASLLQNDSDPESDPLAITAVANATNGTVALANGNVTFTPAANFNGNASFEYTLSDGSAEVTVLVSVAVGSANDAPVAVDDVATTTENTAVLIPTATLLANDTDAEAQALTVASVAGATNGTAVLVGTTVTFTPTAGFSGTGTFTYVVSDGVASDTGLVTVTVTGVNDAPVAVDDALTVAEDVPLVIPFATLVGNDVDLDGPALTVTARANDINGTSVLGASSITFTPTANFNGTASFDYTVSDGTLTDVGHVTITVTAVNDAPVAIDDAGTTAEDTAIVFTTLTANDTDVDAGAVLTVTAVGTATNGTVTLNGGSPRFVPAANFAGTGTFQYTVSDGTLSDGGVVTVTVTPVNDAPVAVDDVATSSADASVTILDTALVANDSDIDTVTLTVTGVQNAIDGTIVDNGNSVTFTPTAGFTGAASFEYIVSDGALTDVGKVVVTVTAGPICGDGVITAPETCDDGNPPANGDGCDTSCQEETGFDCTGAPSTCAAICGDGLTRGTEQCDDNNADETDGCTTQCITGVVCNATEFAPASHFAVDPATGHCFGVVDSLPLPFAQAQAACTSVGGYLATFTSAGERTAVNGLVVAGQKAWIGAQDDANDTDAIFDWVTDEAFTFSAFAAGEPDDDGECLHIVDATGLWGDTDCANATNTVTGFMCEVELQACGDSVLQTGEGEECDDGNTTASDGCSATCQFEGCGDGNVDAGEECDDDNRTDGDGCSSTCQNEGTVVCGNGTVETGETCDDGNVIGSDGCSASCTVEPGAVCGATSPTLCSKLVINEVDYDNVLGDNTGGQFEFIEIVNVGTGAADLTNIAVILENGSSNAEYFFDGTSGAANVGKRLLLSSAAVPASSLAPNGVVVIGPGGLVATLPVGVFNITIVPGSGGFIQNGSPDAVGLFDLASSTMMDALSYEGAITAGTIIGVTGTFSFTEGTNNATGDTGADNSSLQRSPNGQDAQNNSTDFVVLPPTPGLPT
ncbi:MAG: Ig-like domain-containing protein, partial [Kofleriaceae bacterium]